jgi:hypothetical protein
MAGFILESEKEMQDIFGVDIIDRSARYFLSLKKQMISMC